MNNNNNNSGGSSSNERIKNLKPGERAYLYGLFHGISMASTAILEHKRVEGAEMIELIMGSTRFIGMSKPSEEEAVLIATMMAYVLPEITETLLTKAMNLASGKGN